jgi:hypothetical protein
MKRALLTLFSLFVFGAACLPGSGENAICLSTTDCQAHLYCLGASCLGSEVSDGGQICKFTCTVDTDCPGGEACVGANSGCAHCDKSAADGG